MPAAEILQRVVEQETQDEASATAAAMARRRLQLAYRMLLRPSMGEMPWSGTRQVRISGPQLKDPIGIDASEDNRLIIIDEGIPLLAVVEVGGVLSYRVPSSEAGNAQSERVAQRSVSVPRSASR